MKKFLFLSLLALVGLSACTSDEPKQNTDEIPPLHSIKISESQSGIIRNANHFGADLWENLMEINPSGNKVFSPLSIHMALSMMANGADDELAAEMAKILGSEDLAELNALNALMIKELPMVDTSVKIALANSIWVDRSMEIGQPFAETCKGIFGASVFPFDSGTENARKEINSWCSEKTSGMIPEFLAETPMEKVILFNATYFNGRWEKPFDKKESSDRPFRCESGKETSVRMMHIRENFQYLSTDDAEYLTLRYGNQGYWMALLLPKEGKDLDAAMKGLITKEAFESGGEGGYTEIDLTMPCFEIESTFDNELIAALGRMGLGKAFGTPAFGKIADRVSFQSALHKTKISVAEEGTVAAAVTEVGGVTANTPRPLVYMEFNRPFGFMIMERSTGAILFAGKITELQ